MLGKVALVTGATGSIGSSIVSALATAGADIVVHYHQNKTVAQQLVDAIQAKNRRALMVQADVTRYNEVESMIQQAAAQLGNVDILINNAGVHRGGKVQKVPLQDWDTVLNTNLRAAFYATRAAVEGMQREGWGRIINIASVVGIRGFPGDALYGASKAGLIGMTKSVALELVSSGITVNAVAPGFVKSAMTEALSERSLQRIQQMIPIGRQAEPEEIASLVVFLASPQAGYITGATFAVDGGVVT
ncbi:MAG: 3-oxoacyl-ACP reductase FabG [Firmicutes bacterium]|nr:3-oxoacyl-ACP reductase FabG [Bacillota bacterium]